MIATQEPATLCPTALLTWEQDLPLSTADQSKWCAEIEYWLHAGNSPQPLRGPLQRECRPRRTDGMRYANDRPTLTTADFDTMAAPLGCGVSFHAVTSNTNSVSDTNTVNILRDGVLLCGACYAAYVASCSATVYIGIAELLDAGPNAGRDPDRANLLGSLVCGSTAELHWTPSTPKPRALSTAHLAERPAGHWAGDTWISGVSASTERPACTPHPAELDALAALRAQIEAARAENARLKARVARRKPVVV